MIESETEDRSISTEESTLQDAGHDLHEGPATASGPLRLWSRDRVVIPTVAAVIGLDQLTKYLITVFLPFRQSWPAEGFLRLTHATNSGTAFGLLPNQTVFLIGASIVAIGFLLYFYRTQALTNPTLRLAIGLQLGGAFGNLIDRLRSGSVVDFIDVGPWPIFNLADSSIVVGVAILISTLVLNVEKSQPAPSDPEASDPEESGGAGP